MTGTTRHLASLGGLLLLLAGAALLLHVPGAGTVGSVFRTNGFVAITMVAALVYGLAVRFVLRAAFDRRAVWVVLAGAIAMRAALLPGLPFLSSDIYRYVWDGQVQRAGINPYRYVPADPALAALRDAAIFPNINRATYARTIYPPAAQVIFAVVGRVSRTVQGMKLAMLGFEIVTMLCLWRLLAIAGLPPARLLIYAWNPLVLWSFACDGHVDAAAAALLSAALLCGATRRHTVAGAILAAAALVKFLPLAAAPAFARNGAIRGPMIRGPILAGSLVIAALYGLYASAGWHVLGFLPSYGTEEGLRDGGGFWLLAGIAKFAALPSTAVLFYLAACIAACLGLTLWMWRQRSPGAGHDAVRLCRDTAILAGFATAALSPHYPWYFAWLAVPCAIAPIPAVLWLSCAPLLLFLDPFHERFFWRGLIYLPAIALALNAWRQHPHAARLHGAVAAQEGTS